MTTSEHQRVSVRFPWPMEVLSPNNRADRWHKASAFKAYKNNAYYIACGLRRNGWVPVRYEHPLYPEGRVCLDIVFFPPARYHYDEDNLIARFKSGFDAIRDALKIDDHFFHACYDVGPCVQKPGYVQVSIDLEEEGHD